MNLQLVVFLDVVFLRTPTSRPLIMPTEASFHRPSDVVFLLSFQQTGRGRIDQEHIASQCLHKPHSVFVNSYSKLDEFPGTISQLRI